MKKSVKNFIKGMGSALLICPGKASNPVFGKSDKERLESDWLRIGGDLKNSMRKFECGKNN